MDMIEYLIILRIPWPTNTSAFAEREPTPWIIEGSEALLL